MNAIMSEIKEALKNKGFSTNEVSVKQRKSGIIVTIHDLSISKLEIEEIVKPLEIIVKNGYGKILNKNELVTVEKIPTYIDVLGECTGVMEAINKAFEAPMGEVIKVKAKFNEKLILEDCFLKKNEDGNLQLISDPNLVPKEVMIDKIYSSELEKKKLEEIIGSDIFENTLDKMYFTLKQIKNH